MTTAPLPLSARAVAPDLARGAMLLLIALANVHLFLSAAPGVRGYPDDPGAVGGVITFLQMLLVDGRAYPLFALLVGYGAVQLARRWDEAAAIRLLRRRGAWMVAFGAAHGILLFPGDIVGAYGLLLVLLARFLVRGAEVTLRTLAAVGAAITILLGAGTGLRTGALTVPSVATSGVGTAVRLHVGEWLAGTISSALFTAGMLAVGALAARRGLLDEPERHRRLLVRVATGGLVVAVVAGLPLAVAAAGWWRPSVGPSALLGVLHSVGGLAGGIGYAALFGLLATRAAGPVRGALVATGRRSLTFYLAQSMVFCALLPAWTLGLGARIGVPGAALLAVATWIASVLAATLLERAGGRGPAEVLLRRLTYGGPPRTRLLRRPR
ncbi:DUF418 domain-containing protein [Pseudonocardia sp. RS11V-5]|uniref:DUF418 domain-containing protein n=1 Tax=Pseudonocardia terrae TaxID=2905831 RepID=UPI001E3BEC7A|nr:DUF418 domain-containing protein [Pseudonocardia terrae]MCE3554585.1 DUF418 domain-containing protein [Pseudonocardia terrae]